MYHYWKDIPKNKVFNNDQEDIEFKSFEEEIIKKFGLLGQTYLKEKFYKKYQNNEKWNIDDYEDINNFCNKLSLNEEVYTEEMQNLDRDFTFEEISQIILKRPNYKSKGDDKIFYEYISYIEYF